MDAKKLQNAAEKATEKRVAHEAKITEAEAKLKQMKSELSALKAAESEAELAHTFALLKAENIGIDDLKKLIAERKSAQ